MDGFTDGFSEDDSVGLMEGFMYKPDEVSTCV